MNTKATHIVEYMCSYCGAKVKLAKGGGRPAPGKCPRKKNGGPHRWRFNRNLC